MSITENIIEDKVVTKAENDVALIKHNSGDEFRNYFETTEDDQLDPARIDKFFAEADQLFIEQFVYDVNTGVKEHFAKGDDDLQNRGYYQRALPLLERFQEHQAKAGRKDFAVLEAKKNAEINAAWASRKKDHFLPHFKGEKQLEQVPEKHRDRAINVQFIAEANELDPNHVNKNYELFRAQLWDGYEMEGIPNDKGLRDRIKQDLVKEDDRQEFIRDIAKQAESKAMNGDSMLWGSEQDESFKDDLVKHGVSKKEASAIFRNVARNSVREFKVAAPYGVKLADAISKSVGVDLKYDNNSDKSSDSLDILIGKIATLPKEERNRVLYVASKVAEKSGVSTDSYVEALGLTIKRHFKDYPNTVIAGFVKKTGDDTHEDADTFDKIEKLKKAHYEKFGYDFIEKNKDKSANSKEVQAFFKSQDKFRNAERALTSANRRELWHDIRYVRNTIRKVELQREEGLLKSMQQGSIDTVSSILPIAAMALPFGLGNATNALYYSEEDDHSMRREYPEMDANTREIIAGFSGSAKALTNKIAVGKIFSKAPLTASLMKRLGARGAIASGLGRIFKGGAWEYTEERAQEAILPLVHEIGATLSKDVPELKEDAWDKVIYGTNEDGSLREKTKLNALYHPRIFFAVLPLVTLAAGGSTIRDKMGADKFRESLSSEDQLRMVGLTLEEAQEIQKMNEAGSINAHVEFDKIMKSKTPDQIKSASQEALEDGALERTIEAEVMENGTDAQKKAFTETNQALDELKEANKRVNGDIRKTEDGRLEVVFPESHKKVNEYFETEQEAYDAHRSAIEDFDMKQSAEIEAKQAQIEELQSKGIKNADDARRAVGEFVDDAVEGAETQFIDKDHGLKQMLQKGEISTAEALDALRVANLHYKGKGEITLETARVEGENRLRRNAKGFINKIFRGGNVATVFHEASEGYVKNLIKNEGYTYDYFAKHLGDFQRATGQILAKDVNNFTKREVIEGWSELAQAHVYNERESSSFPPAIRAILGAFKHFFNSVLDTASNLLQLKQDGKLDGDFEMHLNKAVGLDEDTIKNNQQKRYEREIMEEMLDPETELSYIMKGKIPRPSDLAENETLKGEVQRIWDELTNFDRKGRRYAGKANAWFADKGSNRTLHRAREHANEEGFAFETEAEMLEALEASITGDSQYPSGQASFSISPAQDASYLSAVDSGDMEKAQAMVDEAAKAAGYDSPKLFHGTDSEFKEFKLNRLGLSFLTPDENFAKDYTTKGNTLNLYVPTVGIWDYRNKKDIEIASIHSGRREDVLAKGHWGDLEDRTLVESLKKLGYKGMMVMENGINNYAMFYPSQIKSADPVTYDSDGNVIPLSERFNEKDDRISYSIAPAQDASYLSAVDSGDMEKAQAMVDKAAKRAGYDTNDGDGYWHGGSKWIKANGDGSFVESDIANIPDDYALFLTDEESYAEDYAGQYEDGNQSMKRLFVKMNKKADFLYTPYERDADRYGVPYLPNHPNEEYISDEKAVDGVRVNPNFDPDLNSISHGSQSEQVKKAKRLGYDGIAQLGDTLGNSFGIKHLLVFNPNQIKSADPVTYDTDGNVIPLSERFNDKDDRISYSIAPAQDAIEKATQKAITNLENTRNNRSNLEIDWEEDTSRDPDEEGRHWYAERTFPNEEQYLDEFVENPSIILWEDKYLVGENESDFDSLEEAQEYAEELMVESYQEEAPSSTFGSDTDARDAAGIIFESFPDLSIIKEDWRGSKWGSHYMTLKDGSKLSVRDHGATRKDMGLPDYSYEIGKEWKPESVRDALLSMLEWIESNQGDNLTESDKEKLTNKNYQSTSFSISPAQDASYLSAVDSGDMEKAQAMVDEAAKAAGYDSPKVYHGTEANFDVFDIESPIKNGRGEGRGFYFIEDRKIAKKYAGKKGRVLSSYLKLTKRFDGFDSLSKREQEIYLDTKSDEEAYDKLGVDWFQMGGQIIVRNPNQIKSADPVTYDTDGNVIPLSERFNDKDDRISYSIAPAQDPLIAKIQKLIRDPETKATVFKVMATRLSKLKAKQNAKLTKRLFDGEGELSSHEELLDSIAQLDAIIAVLPREVRGQIRGYKKLAELKTVKGRTNYLIKRMERVDDVLEKFMVKSYKEAIKKMFDKSKPKSKNKASDAGQSKIGAIGHLIAEAAQAASVMNAEQAELRAAEIRREVEDPQPEEQQELEDRAYVTEMFADMESADSNRLDQLLDILQSNWDEGRKEWVKVLAERKEWKDSTIEKARQAFGVSVRNDGDTTSKTGREDGLIKKMAKDALNIFHVGDLLREGDKNESDSVWKEFNDDLRRAKNKNENLDLKHREEMKSVIVRIFGFKRNKQAQVQDRLRVLSKQVKQTGVTKTQEYELEIATNQKDLDKAEKAFQAGEDIVIRGNTLTKSEYQELSIGWQDAVANGYEPAGRKLFRYSLMRNEGERSSIGEMSQLDMLKDWLSIQQKDLKEKYEKNGYDEQYRDELDSALEDDVKELGLWMQNKLKDDQEIQQALHREEYGLALRLIDNYFPAVFEHGGKQSTTLTMDGVEIGQSTNRPSAHKLRVNHNSRPKKQNAFAVFNGHIMQRNFWESHAEVLRKWASVIRDKNMQDYILRAKGQTTLNLLNRWLSETENQGADVAKVHIETDHLWRSIGKGMALGILGGRISTIFKNLIASTNVVLSTNFTDLLRGFSPELMNDVRDLYESDTFQRRLKMGATVATRHALEARASGRLELATAVRAAEYPVQAINLADTLSNMTFALAYRAKIKELLKSDSKMTEAEAKEKALDHVDDLVDRFAQPTSRLSKSLWENTRTPESVFLVQFMSDARKLVTINMLALRKIFTGKGVGNRSDASRQLITSIIVNSLLVHVVDSLMSAFVKGEGDDPEEEFINQLTDGKRIASAMMTESFAGIPLLGDGWKMIVNESLGQKTYDSSSNPATKLAKSASSAYSLLTDDKDRTASEMTDSILRVVQGFGSISPYTSIFSQGANVARDGLGFYNNTLDKGLSEEDSKQLSVDRITKKYSAIKKVDADTYKDADKLEKKQISSSRHEAIEQYLLDYLMDLPEKRRKQVLEELKEKKGSVPKEVLKRVEREVIQ